MSEKISPAVVGHISNVAANRRAALRSIPSNPVDIFSCYFNKFNVASGARSRLQALEAKLLALELTDGESDALAALVACAEQTADEVTGFDAITGLTAGGLRFLTDLDKRPGALLPDEGVFASAGGLGSTRVKDGYMGGVVGDE